MTKVSVIVPIYNAEKYLRTCLNSLVNQTLKDIEIITVNDGSKDKSSNILDQYQNQYKNIKRIDTFNNGVGAARNLGLSVASGQFIKFVDADDYLPLNILEKMYKIAKENNVKLVRGNYRNIIGPIKTNYICNFSGINDDKIVDVSKNKDYIVQETSGIGNKLISFELLQKLNFPNHTKWEDLAIMPVIIAQAGKIYHMNEPVYNYRMGLNTRTKDFILKIPNILDIIKCLDMVELEMKKRNLDQIYNEQIKSLYILHTLFRVENTMLWLNEPLYKKKIVINSLINLLELKYPDWKNNNIIEEYKNVNWLFKYNMNRLEKYTKDHIVEKDIEKIKTNILQSF